LSAFLATPSAQLSGEAFNFDWIALVASELASDQHRRGSPAAFLLEADEFGYHLLAPRLANSSDGFAWRNIGRHLARHRFGQSRNDLGDRLIAR
jgi:hypothetical protein